MKNFLQNPEFQLDEVLFEHRNQNYGAYVLRHEADRTLTKAMFAGIIFFAAIAVTPFILNGFKTADIKTKIPEGIHQIIEIDEPIYHPPVAQVQPIAPAVATTKYDIPTPTRNPVKQTPATSVKDFQDTAIGTVNTVGTPPTMSVSPPENVIAPTVTGPVLPKTIDNSPKKHVDVEAQFSKGLDGFRNGMINNFDGTGFDGVDDVMRTTLTFIVEKDGSISDIKANGGNKDFNQEAIKTLKTIKGKWTPAKLGGESVRSYFSFPVSMKFD
ncbi:energy transducer TonB [Halpernia frigidisoli]|uniref:Protein TonB n=1 Tax=Halpernia frigidisoli TaxID=1125876 RepID=A0A1I3E6T7_9FLAO|nr:hypothetical protein [Halpernia frigidisoli]SFH94707.1 protein TonB [Halpernia frigidisoli]